MLIQIKCYYHLAKLFDVSGKVTRKTVKESDKTDTVKLSSIIDC